MSRRESVEIYKSRITGIYKLQRKCPHPTLGGPTSFGDPEIFSEDRFKAEGLTAIENALSSSMTPCPNVSGIKRFTQKDYAAFRKEHDLVAITRWADEAGNVSVEPMIHDSGGYRNIKDRRMIVTSSEVGLLVETVLKAFVIINLSRKQSSARSGEQTRVSVAASTFLNHHLAFLFH